MKQLTIILLVAIMATISCTKDNASSLTNFDTIGENHPELVDLGLSVKWASFNLGASKPEECGSYFAWGDIKGQIWSSTISSWLSSGFSTNPSFEIYSNKNLKPDYDAAHILLGGNWRMPTKAECQELLDNCTSTWTDNYNKTGVAGRIYTSKKTGYTNISIFLPAAGVGEDYGLYGAGTDGYYRSSTYDEDDCSWFLTFLNELDWVDSDDAGYHCGMSIRPVSD